jgi:hypothetical protein
MSYIDIEEQLDKITGNLRQELEKANAIGTDGRATNVLAFDRVIDSMIDQCQTMIQQSELQRLEHRFDANSRSLIESTIAWLREIKNAHSIAYPTNLSDGKEEEIIQKTKSKSPNDFTKGTGLVHRLFGFQRRAPQKLGHGK